VCICSIIVSIIVYMVYNCVYYCDLVYIMVYKIIHHYINKITIILDRFGPLSYCQKRVANITIRSEKDWRLNPPPITQTAPSCARIYTNFLFVRLLAPFGVTEQGLVKIFFGRTVIFATGSYALWPTAGDVRMWM
jgi:hypothetical protein